MIELERERMAGRSAVSISSVSDRAKASTSFGSREGLGAGAVELEPDGASFDSSDCRVSGNSSSNRLIIPSMV